MHDKGLRRQIGTGTLVSSLERRALVIPRINRGSTAGFVPLSVYMGFPLFVLLKKHSKQLSAMPVRHEGRLPPGRDDPSASHPARPRPAPPPRRAPPRPDPPVVCPGFGLDRLLKCLPLLRLLELQPLKFIPEYALREKGFMSLDWQTL